ncbi:MAG: amidohydrolase [Dactylosporangium sp.]|jgi:amidohydrolase|nr:amidohydrolase [Dactylosporangium sp.]
MNDKEALKARVCAEIDRRSDEIVAISDHVMRNPETGYREVKTAAFVADHFARLGLPYRDKLALTGVKARMAGTAPGPTVALMGELDSLVSVNHPYADPVTGAAHCCGHNAMIGSMLGAAFGLRPVMEQLAGDVVLFAVPAEEGIELEYRMELRERGEIEFIQGKPELIRLGEFDDVDIAMITHTTDDAQPWLANPGSSTIGALKKLVVFRGRAAHAGGWPWEGVNALKAATLAMTGMDFQRETFRDDDNVRIHWNLTKGGEAVSAVPDDVRLDVMVRANRVEAMLDASAKVDRALRAGALALGAEVDITTMSGVLPMQIDSNLRELVRRNQEAFLGADRVGPPGHSTAGTDVGDLGHIMPVCQPLATGVTSAPHTEFYHVTDHVKAAVNPAKFMAMTVVDLLYDRAAEARRVIAEAAPSKITKDEYLAIRRAQDTHEVFDGGLRG